MLNFLKTKTATVFLFGFLIMIGFATARLLAQKYTIDKQIKELQARVDRVKGDNAQLSDLIKYLNTPQYQEKEAREKLNLKKDGEFVVGLPAGQSEPQGQVSGASKTNPQKWYDFFFKNARS